jgi:hypothetical protein
LFNERITNIKMSFRYFCSFRFNFINWDCIASLMGWLINVELSVERELVGGNRSTLRNLP